MTFQIDGVYLSAHTSRVFEGAIGSLEDSAVRQEGDDGLVQCVGRWARRRRKWQLTWGTSDADTIETLFEVCGNSIGFLWVPPRLRDYTVTDGVIGTGNGVTTIFQLKKTVATYDLTPTLVRAVTWNILYPLNSTSAPSRPNAVAVSISVDGTPLTPVTDFTVGSLGVITCADPPETGAEITATFQYATPVQFLSESIETTMLSIDQEEVRSATIGEVFL